MPTAINGIKYSSTMWDALKFQAFLFRFTSKQIKTIWLWFMNTKATLLPFHSYKIKILLKKIL
jgi:hypothetical protein